MAATSSIANLFSFFAPSPPSPPPKSQASHLSLSSSAAASNTDRLAPLISSSNEFQPLSPSPGSSSELMSVVCPSLAYANTLFHRSTFAVELVVDEDEPEDTLIERFRREVMRSGVLQETRRRRYHETKQEERKRKKRDAARRNRRRRYPFQSSPSGSSEEDPFKKKKDDDDDDNDNWDLPEDDGLPY